MIRRPTTPTLFPTRRSSDLSPQDTVTGIDAIVSQLRHRLPTTKLLLLGVLPSERSDWVSQATAEINRGLAARYRGDSEVRSEEHTSELQSHVNLVCRLLLEK